MSRFKDLIFGDPTATRIVPPSGFTAALTLASAAAMAFLAVFAIALNLATGELANRWEAELAGTATVRVPPSGDIEARAEAVLVALSQTPGVVTARRVDDEEQLMLLAPWFGEGIPLDKLRLPVLIEVEETADGPDEVGLSARLDAEAPGTVYDDHSRWRLPLAEAAQRLRQLGAFALFLIGSVTAVTISLAASSALSANGQIIDVLRIVGAKDRWIASAFIRRFTVRAFVGAAIGTVAAMIAVALLPDGVEIGVLSGLGFQRSEWLWPLLVPFGAAGLAFAATWVAAARRLKEDG
ncbi:MAG: FtsX-like permease family protein [Pseudomonadota bacterium]